MQVPNPLVPTSASSGGAAPAPIANAPFVPDSTKHQTARPVTARPVTASRDSERAGAEDRNAHGEDAGQRPYRRGEYLDITV